MRRKPAASRKPSASKAASPTARASPDAWRKDLEAWKNLGATHVSFNTMKAGLKSPSAHIEAIRRFARVDCGKLTSRIGRYYLTAKDTKITKVQNFNYRDPSCASW